MVGICSFYTLMFRRARHVAAAHLPALIVCSHSGTFNSVHHILQVEHLIKYYKNVLTLRIRMPITDDLSPRSFVTKIVHYERVVDIPNSMTILTDLMPVSVEAAQVCQS